MGDGGAAGAAAGAATAAVMAAVGGDPAAGFVFPLCAHVVTTNIGNKSKLATIRFPVLIIKRSFRALPDTLQATCQYV
jgi:uncharacterized membrane protein